MTNVEYKIAAIEDNRRREAVYRAIAATEHAIRVAQFQRRTSAEWCRTVFLYDTVYSVANPVVAYFKERGYQFETTGKRNGVRQYGDTVRW